jgi:hypothetical protein
MADTKVSDLPAITLPIDVNDILYIGDISASTSNKITYQNLFSTVNNEIVTLNGNVSDYTTIVLDLSATFENANLNIGPLTTDVLELSGQVLELSANQVQFISDTENIIDSTIQVGYTGPVVISGTTLTFLSGVLITVT